jgi:hypothetical protein
MTPISRTELRRPAGRQAAEELLQGSVDRDAAPYLAYHGLYRLWCGHNAVVQELRPLFLRSTELSRMDAFVSLNNLARKL